MSETESSVNQMNDPAPDNPRPMPHAEPEPQATARSFAIEAARLLADSHCQDVLIFDVRGISDVTHYLILATGTSDRQLKGVAQYVEDLAQQCDLDRFGIERDEATKWVVLDFVDVMVHLFEPATRAHYDLEMLWGDAPRVPWQRQSDAEASEASKDR